MTSKDLEMQVAIINNILEVDCFLLSSAHGGYALFKTTKEGTGRSVFGAYTSETELSGKMAAYMLGLTKGDKNQTIIKEMHNEIRDIVENYDINEDVSIKLQYLLCKGESND